MKSTSKIAILLIIICIFASNVMFCAKACAKDKTQREKELFLIEEESKFEIHEGGVNVKVKDFKYEGNQEFSISFVWTVIDPIENDYTVFLHFFNKEYGDTDNMYTVFQYDHQPSEPTLYWKPKKPVVDGPYYVTITNKCGAGIYYIAIGLYNETERYNDISGPNDGYFRTILGKLILKGEPGKITNIKFQPLENQSHKKN